MLDLKFESKPFGAFLLVFLCLAAALSACSADKQTAAQPAAPGPGSEPAAPPAAAASTVMPLTISSPTFSDNGSIPVLYSCQGRNISPPLKWGQPPTGTKSLALILQDPDTPHGTLTHWVVFNIAPASGGLPEAIPEQAAASFLQGTNSFGMKSYFGHCTPSGSRHRYQFYLYALDTLLKLDSGASQGQVSAAMQGHILGQGLLTGLFASQ